MATPTTKRQPPKTRGPNRLNQRDYPPVDGCSPAEWAWRTRSPVYRKKIKRAVEGLNAFLRLTKGPLHRGATGGQVDFCHFMLDELRPELRGNRRERGGNTVKEQLATITPDAAPTTSLKY